MWLHGVFGRLFFADWMPETLAARNEGTASYMKPDLDSILTAQTGAERVAGVCSECGSAA